MYWNTPLLHFWECYILLYLELHNIMLIWSRKGANEGKDGIDALISSITIVFCLWLHMTPIGTIWNKSILMVKCHIEVFFCFPLTPLFVDLRPNSPPILEFCHSHFYFYGLLYHTLKILGMSLPGTAQINWVGSRNHFRFFAITSSI